MSSAEIEVQGIGESEWSEVELQLTEEEEQLEEDLEDSNSNNNNKAALLAFKKRKRSLCEKTGGGGTGEMAWDIRRRRQNEQKRRNNSIHDCNDEDLRELRGCIELGFGFNEEDGQTLCNTLPALDLYFAVNRHLIISTPPVPTPRTINHSRSSSSIGSSPSSTLADSESWKICSPGDDPAQIKTKLRHWAQAVACSVMQSHN